MSLLLEALKKAEKAKEEAQRRARGEPEAPANELHLEAEDAATSRGVVPGAAPVMTKDQLPDIRQPLEIQADEPPPRAAPKAPPPPPAAERKGAAAPAADAQASSRAAARKVFEAKFKEPNPRLPFFITMGALGVFAVGTAVYFWIQLQPPPALVNANPPRKATEAVAAAEPAATPAGAAAANRRRPRAFPACLADPPLRPRRAPKPRPNPRRKRRAPNSAGPKARARRRSCSPSPGAWDRAWRRRPRRRPRCARPAPRRRCIPGSTRAIPPTSAAT
jgi:hypothetical protein